MISNFFEKVMSEVKRIPRGKLTTYKLLASRIGAPGAFRAVGNALNKNDQLVTIPCHRVIHSDGRVGGYAGGLSAKIDLLRGEGIEIIGEKVLNLKRYL